MVEKIVAGKLARPKKVERAIIILWTVLVLGIATLLLPGGDAWADSEITFYIGLIISACLNALFIYQSGHGKHWARMALLVLFIPQVILLVIGFIDFMGLAQWSTALIVWRITDVIFMAAYGYALLLIFSEEASDWYDSEN